MKDMRLMSRDGEIDKVPEVPVREDGQLPGKPVLEPLYTPQEIADALGVSRAMVYKLVKEGELEGVHIGRSVRIRPESYMRYLDDRS